MLYTFYTKLSTPTDANLSFKLMKHPQNEYAKTFNTLSAIGRFTRNGMTIDPQSYEILLTNALTEVPNSNKVSWNFVELSALSLRELNVIFNNMWRSALRGHVDSLITQEIVDEQHSYNLQLSPVDPGSFRSIEKFAKYQQIAMMLGLDLTYNEDSFTVTIETVNVQTLKHFLQKSYLLVFSMLAKYSILSDLSKDKVEQMVRMSDEWIMQINDDALRNYFIKNLLKYRIGLIEHFNSESTTEVEENVRLHELKHNKIVEFIKDVQSTVTHSPDESIPVVEFGCSTGQLPKVLATNNVKVDYLGIDAEHKSIEKAKRKLRKFENFRFSKNDFLCEYIDNAQLPYVMLLVEVIEHLEEDERLTLAKLMDYVYNPEFIIITTPNVDYNVNYGLAEGQYRHRDHKIEMQEFELRNYLFNFTNYQIHEWVKLTDEEIDPSFMVILRRVRDDVNDAFVTQFKEAEKEHLIEKAQFEAPFLMPSFDYIVTSKELRIGRDSRAFKMNQDSVFYLGATMAPADVKQMYGRSFDTFSTDYDINPVDIEHPKHALEYYRTHGVDDNELVGEIKYMGSRGYILAFKTAEIAAQFNMPVITINSRSGYTFFDDEQQDIVNSVYDTISKSFFTDSTGLDFIMLDCEITPWALKAKNLIYYDFELPVLLQYAGFTNVFMTETFADIVDASSDYYDGSAYCISFLDTLENFSKHDNVSIYIFDVIASGNMHGKRVDLLTNRETERDSVNQFLHYNLIKNDIVKVATQVRGGKAIIDLWNSINDEIEGIVIKPNRYTYYNGSGVLPYMKCRRDSYMSLVYGPYYYDGTKSPVIEKVFWRNIAKKRRLSIFQDELSHMIVKSFFKNDKSLLKKYIAAFYATDGTGNFGGIDPTL